MGTRARYPMQTPFVTLLFRTLRAFRKGVKGALSRSSLKSSFSVSGAKRNVRGNTRHIPPKTPFLKLLFRTPDLGFGDVTWPRGSTGVQRYGCILRSAANNLGQIPRKMGAPKSLVLKRRLWDSSLPVSLTVWDTSVLCAPPLPLSQF